MNKRLLNSRFYQISVLILILMVVLSIRLFMLTIIEKDEWEAAASNQNTKEITTSAPRGQILDRYGRVLATNKQVFTVNFNTSGMATEEINASAYSLVKLLEKNGDDKNMVDNFPIIITESGKFKYTYEDDKKEWLKDQGFASNLTAEEAFEKLRLKYEIDPSLDRFDAAEVLADMYSVYPPIYVKSMTYTYDNSIANFLAKYGLEDGLSAKEAFNELKKTYKLDEFVPEGRSKTLSDKEIRKIFIVREEVKNLGFNKYQTCTIATDVGSKTIAYIEEMGEKLTGVSISSETVRYYPNGRLLSHVLGYMGSISDSEYEYYVNEKGYSASDLIGKDGVEATFESSLRGIDGVQTIRVNSSGEYIDTISETEPEAGKDVYLTIDKDLQEVAEETLEGVIEAVQTGAVFKSKYGNLSTTRFPKCESGAVVALEVETGEVLAMASYPDYNPNRFAEGITTKDWAAVQSTNPRDLLAPTPLYNIATKSSVQPGSIFKPVTAVAALKAGLNPDTPIYDRGYIDVGDLTFGCDSWNRFRGNHGVETLKTGIQNSCNFYFACIATGTNYNNNASLGYRDNISIESIMDVAKEFGLDSGTGIELTETVAALPTADAKLINTKNNLWYTLYINAAQYFPKSIYENEEKLKENLNTLCSWLEENPDRGTLITMVDEQTDVKKTQVEAVADLCKYSFYNQAQWTQIDEFNIAIGQGENMFTPLQMARYVATLGNDGERNEVSLLKGIEGEGLKDKGKTYQINVTEEQMAEVLEGMRLVTTNGTLAGIYGRKFPVDVAGKTGTAQKSGYINPKDEVAYVKNNLSRIAPGLSWAEVEAEMEKLMKEDPKKYATENDAVDTAVIKASDNKVTINHINKYKDTYDEFAWTITLAPADDPKIAVVALLVQGGTSYNAGIVTREIIGEYLGVGAEDDEDEELDFSTIMMQ